MSGAIERGEQDLLEQLKATAGATWAKIPDAHKSLAERTAIRWGILTAKELLGVNEADILMEARAIEAIFSVIEDEVETLIKAAILEYVEKGAVIVGKVAMNLLKGAIPGLGSIPGLG